MANKKVKPKKKNDIVFIIAISIILVVLVLASIIGNTKPNKKVEVSSEGQVISITIDELKEKIDNKEDFIFVLGYSGCEPCENYMSVFKRAQSIYNFKAYYIDINSIDTSSKTWKNIMKDVITKQTMKNTENKEFEDTVGNIALKYGYTPITFGYNNGVCINAYVGALDSDNFDSYYSTLQY